MSTKYPFNESWQYIPEDTPKFSTSVNPLHLPGFITGETQLQTMFNAKDYRGLKVPTVTDLRGIDSVQTTKYEYKWGITYVPLKLQSSLAKYDWHHFAGMALNNSSSTAAGGGWTWGTTLTTNTNTFTLYKLIDNLAHQFQGCKIQKFTGKCSKENPVEFTADGIAQYATFTTLSRTTASSLTNGTPFLWSDVQIYINGSLATYCEAFDFTFDNKGESVWVLGNKEPLTVSTGPRTIEVTITRQYQSQELYTDAKNNTADSITIALNDPAGTDYIGFRGCKLDTHPIPADAITSTAPLVQQLKFTAQAAFIA